MNVEPQLKQLASVARRPIDGATIPIVANYTIQSIILPAGYKYPCYYYFHVIFADSTVAVCRQDKAGGKLTVLHSVDDGTVTVNIPNIPPNTLGIRAFTSPPCSTCSRHIHPQDWSLVVSVWPTSTLSGELSKPQYLGSFTAPRGSTSAPLANNHWLIGGIDLGGGEMKYKVDAADPAPGVRSPFTDLEDILRHIEAFVTRNDENFQHRFVLDERIWGSHERCIATDGGYIIPREVYFYKPERHFPVTDRFWSVALGWAFAVMKPKTDEQKITAVCFAVSSFVSLGMRYQPDRIERVNGEKVGTEFYNPSSLLTLGGDCEDTALIALGLIRALQLRPLNPDYPLVDECTKVMDLVMATSPTVQAEMPKLEIMEGKVSSTFDELRKALADDREELAPPTPVETRIELGATNFHQTCILLSKDWVLKKVGLWEEREKFYRYRLNNIITVNRQVCDGTALLHPSVGEAIPGLTREGFMSFIEQCVDAGGKPLSMYTVKNYPMAPIMIGALTEVFIPDLADDGGPISYIVLMDKKTIGAQEVYFDTTKKDQNRITLEPMSPMSEISEYLDVMYYTALPNPVLDVDSSFDITKFDLDANLILHEGHGKGKHPIPHLVNFRRCSLTSVGGLPRKHMRMGTRR